MPEREIREGGQAVPMVTQLSAALANRTGTLATLAGALGEEGIRVHALMIYEGRARMLVDNPVRARAAIDRLGLQVYEDEVLAFEIETRPGALGQATRAIAEAGVNIDYCYTGASSSEGKVLAVFVVSDLEKSLKAVGERP